MAHHKRPGLAATSTSQIAAASLLMSKPVRYSSISRSVTVRSPGTTIITRNRIASEHDPTTRGWRRALYAVCPGISIAHLAQIDQHPIARERTSTAPSALKVIRTFPTLIAHRPRPKLRHPSNAVIAICLLLPFHSPLASLARLVSADARLVSQPAASLLLHLHDWRVSGPN